MKKETEQLEIRGKVVLNTNAWQMRISKANLWLWSLIWAATNLWLIMEKLTNKRTGKNYDKLTTKMAFNYKIQVDSRGLRMKSLFPFNLNMVKDYNIPAQATENRTIQQKSLNWNAAIFLLKINMSVLESTTKFPKISKKYWQLFPSFVQWKYHSC